MALFFDVIPPNYSAKKEGIPNKKTKGLKKKTSRYRMGNFLIFLGMILVAGFIYQWFWAKTTVEIWPETEIIQQQEEIVVDYNCLTPDKEKNIIPGKLFTDSREKQRQFISTGTKEGEEKAKGLIRVYNAYSPAKPITLRSGTRFLSSSGQYFRSPESIYLPAAKFQEGELVPQWVEINVVAMESGSSSNIGPTNFSIPGLLGTNYYDRVYAQSFADMEGGEIKVSKQVTAKDLEEAGNELKQELIAICEEDFRKEAGPNFIFLEEASSQEMVESESSIKEGTILDQFDYYGKVEVKSLAFSKEDLREIAFQLITVTAEEDGRIIVPDSLDLSYQLLTANLDQGRAVLILNLSAKGYVPLSVEEIKDRIKGLNSSKALSLLSQNYLSIRDLQIKMRPFWMRKIPSSSGRIGISLNW